MHLWTYFTNQSIPNIKFGNKVKRTVHNKVSNILTCFGNWKKWGTTRWCRTTTVRKKNCSEIRKKKNSILGKQLRYWMTHQTKERGDEMNLLINSNELTKATYFKKSIWSADQIISNHMGKIYSLLTFT